MTHNISMKQIYSMLFLNNFKHLIVNNFVTVKSSQYSIILLLNIYRKAYNKYAIYKMINCCTRANNSLKAWRLQVNSTFIDRKGKGEIKTGTRNQKGRTTISDANFVTAGWKLVDNRFYSELMYWAHTFSVD